MIEETRVHRIDAIIDANTKPAYTIDWLDNVPDLFHWPDTIRRKVSTARPRRIVENDDGITLTSSEGNEGFGRRAAKLLVAGKKAFFCALDRKEVSDHQRPGCIVYLGTPDQQFRKRMRMPFRSRLAPFSST
ncbi:hypothetical protein HAP48_0011125 [Bradyrhizobium septentrionale]|uniref:Uncharacterized protein n=1 Tax=Bradyrhizobium septentrionale TaxID=1404411 RepID=A0A973W8N2_9BRAD|nr:hypothetical protein [Bradyrhizobium septentrionale]UGY17927.1 hypothetical protein HAP48_0011125 [Bradyrhizobium septentrionale]